VDAVWSEEEEIEFAKEGKTFAMKTAYVYLSLFGLCVHVCTLWIAVLFSL